MLAEVLAAEVDACLPVRGEHDERGHRLVVCDGHHEPQEVMTSAGAVAVRAPWANDKRINPSPGRRRRFCSRSCRRGRGDLEDHRVLSLLHLHGLSSGDVAPALGQVLGSAAGVSAVTFTKLTEQGRAETTGVRRA